jgi:hypothetical protein
VLITRSVRLTTPLLASRPTRGTPPRREFDKIPTKPGEPVRIKTYVERWNWAFLEARDALGFLDASVATIIPTAYYEVKKTSTYNRTYNGSRETDSFESITSGTVLQWHFTLSQHLPPHAEDSERFTRPATEEEFDAMLAHIGEHLGMSHWGHDYLFGRFNIHTPPNNEPTR